MIEEYFNVLMCGVTQILHKCTKTQEEQASGSSCSPCAQLSLSLPVMTSCPAHQLPEKQTDQ